MSKLIRLLVGAPALCLAVLAACEPAAVPSRATIDEPRYLGFRCVREEPAERGEDVQVGVPLEACGCVERTADGFRALGRVECSCRVIAAPTPGGAERHTCFNGRDDDGDGDADQADESCRTAGADDRFVEGSADPCTNGADDDRDGLVDDDDPDCEADVIEGIEEADVDAIAVGADGRPARDPQTGDFVPVPEETPGFAPCVPRGMGEMRGYVGATGRGEVAVLDLTDDERIEDVAPTIPGTNAIFVDDLISDVGAHPDGDFVFTVNSSTGTLSVIHDDRKLRPDFHVQIADEPLLELLVWPAPGTDRLADDRPAPRAWVSAPDSGRLYEIDLDALGAATDKDADVVAAVITLPAGTRPGRLAVDPTGETLYVAHADASRVTVLDAGGSGRAETFTYAGEEICADGYLVGVVDRRERDVCADGLDNDGDGLGDAADPDCAAGLRWENWEGATWVPGCSRVPECGDGVDNDGDGAVDAADPECAADFRFEGEVPECSNGVDDDGDGEIDRADPGCADETDDVETDRETPGPACEDDGDNDGDGLVDDDDPGCTDPDAAARYDFEALPECGDGRDQDGDDKADFPNDPDCFAASDTNEGESAVRLGAAALVAVRVDVEGGPRSFLYFIDRTNGRLSALETDEAGWPIPGARPQAVPVTGALQALALRQLGANASLAVVDDATTLRSVEIVAPVPLVDQAGNEVYARLQLPDARECPTDGDMRVEGFYVVVEGAAWAVDDPALEPFVGSCSADDRVEVALPVASVRSRIPGDAEAAVPFEVIDVEATASIGARGTTDPPVFLGGRHPARRVLNEPLNVLRSAFTRTPSATEAALRVQNGSAVFDAARHPAFCRLESALEVATCHNGTDDDADGLIDADDPDCAAAADDDGTLPDEVTPVVTPDGEVEPARPCHDTTDNDGDGLVDAEDPACTQVGAVTGTEPETAECNLAGLGQDGRPEATETYLERTRHRVDPQEAIHVVTRDPARIPGGRWAVSFEGVIPRTESRSGQFGGRDAEAGTWVLLDYNQDFCRSGVEPGDVVLVDRFVPATEEDITVPAACASPSALSADERAECERRETCRTLEAAPETAATRRQIEPLRYEVVENTAHRLLLKPESRVSYSPQLAPDARTPLPQLADSPPIPYSECAAGLTTYRVRAANDEWLFTIGDSYLHPRINRAGQCVEDPRRVEQGRVGRFRLGEVFENTYVRFRLGHLPFRGSDTDALPFMAGVTYEFSVQPGVAFSTLVDVAVMPQDMAWLPFDDRLYVVDSAFETVVEVTGLDMLRVVGESFLEPPTMRVVRRFE